MFLRQGQVRVLAALILVAQLGAAAKYLSYQNTKGLCTANTSLASEVRSYALLNAIYADLGELKYSLQSVEVKPDGDPNSESGVTTLGDLIGARQIESIEKEHAAIGREIRELSLKSKISSIQANKSYVESMNLQNMNCQNIESGVNWIYYFQTILMVLLSLLTIIGVRPSNRN